MTSLAAFGSSLVALVVSPGNGLVEALAGASIRGAAAVAVVAAASAGAKGLAPRTKSWLWWFACLAFVVPPLPGIPGNFGVPVAIPEIGERSAASSRAIGTGQAAIAAERGEPMAAGAQLTSAADPASVGVPRAFAILGERASPLASLLAILWAAGAFLFATIGVVRVVRARAWATKDVGELAEMDQALAHRLATEAGLACVPRVVLSRRAPVPLVVSIGAPTIVLPSATWDALDRSDRALVLAHEIAHVARRDALRSWVPWIVDCLFWFHPLARFAASEFAAWREAACDADVLAERRAAASRYAELLVKLGVAPRLSWAGVGASSEFRTLKRRILMLDRLHERGGARLAVFAFLLLVTIAVVPVRFLDSSASAEIGTAPEAPRKISHSTTWSAGLGRQGVSFFFVDGDESHLVGSAADAKRLEGLARKTKSERFLLVRNARGTFLLEDEQTLAEAKALFAPVEQLGAKQGELGELQGELGGRQGELGELQGELGELQSELAERMVRLEEKFERAEERDDREGIAAGAAEREELARRMEELAGKQSELGDRQAELGEKQSQLGERQSELGEAQQQASLALRERLAELLETKIDAGVAERLGD